MKDKGWTVQVIPEDDLILHQANFFCVCHPVVINGTIVHNSVDKRELNELAHEIYRQWLNS
jgi:hypothetical protein